MNSQLPSSHTTALKRNAVDDTLSSLSRHMGQCQQAQGPWFGLQAKAELAHTLVASRLVTCGALAALGCWALIRVA